MKTIKRLAFFPFPKSYCWSENDSKSYCFFESEDDLNISYEHLPLIPKFSIKVRYKFIGKSEPRRFKAS